MEKKPSIDPINEIDTISQSQKDMCQAYGNDSIGIIVSGLMWLTSSIGAFQFSPKQAVWVLLVGGMLVDPLSVIMYKLIGLSGVHNKGNPLANLAMEATVWMLMCIPLAFGLSLQHTEWFFQAMLMIIGGRYLTFASMYGNRLYWILGAVLGIAAYVLLFFLNLEKS